MMSVGEHRSAVRQTVPSARLHSSLDVPIYIYLFELCYLFYIILCYNFYIFSYCSYFCLFYSFILY